MGSGVADVAEVGLLGRSLRMVSGVDVGLKMSKTLLEMSYTRLQPGKTVVDQVQLHNKLLEQFGNAWRMLVCWVWGARCRVSHGPARRFFLFPCHLAACFSSSVSCRTLFSRVARSRRPFARHLAHAPKSERAGVVREIQEWVGHHVRQRKT